MALFLVLSATPELVAGIIQVNKHPAEGQAADLAQTSHVSVRPYVGILAYLQRKSYLMTGLQR